MKQPGLSLLTQRSPRVVSARKLLQRKHRSSQRQFLAEGPQAVREALRKKAVAELFVGESDKYADLAQTALEQGIRVSALDNSALATLTETVTPQGIVAVCTFVDKRLDELHIKAMQLAVMATQISDPGNAGTVLRTADAAGADAVIFSEDSVDPYNGKCVRASVGSIFHPAIVRGGASTDVVRTFEEAGFQILATTGYGDVGLFELAVAGELAKPTLWLFGNEAHGLSGELLELAHRKVAIPIYGEAESLNLATAAAVCLYSSAQAQN
ncbi:MAG: RNA methyltransferase [Corynebacteriales bacterium]|nr:RNA methyltransferase [Mycobacteriales bacterium]